MSPLAPGATIGILGGGQLGRMMALAAGRLGFNVAILSPEIGSPAARVAATALVMPYASPEALKMLAGVADVVTLEFENVPVEALTQLEALGVRVAPGPKALAVAQDRLLEKQTARDLGLMTTGFAAIDSAADIAAALETLGAPAVLKTRREGYDGKGQVWIQGASDSEAASAHIGGAPAILEAKAPFVRELSVIAARSAQGDIAVYPLGENHHDSGILRTTFAPAAVTPEVQAKAEDIAARLLVGLDYVGVMGVELFDLGDGVLWLNEFAPRVHNSGHWTQDGTRCDQFEQAIRAIAGWPLGPTDASARVEMTNLLGDEVNAWMDLSRDPAVRLHFYGKAEARAGRKMAHVNRILGPVELK